jgi:hypothetical protein
MEKSELSKVTGETKRVLIPPVRSRPPVSVGVERR